MENNNFFSSITLQNFLSFGDKSHPVDFAPLNILIGKNSCGKSNLIEAFAILKSLSKDLLDPIRKGGGIKEWLWKGKEKQPIAKVDLTLNYPGDAIPLRYKLDFTEVNQRLELVDEVIESVQKRQEWDEDVCFYYRYRNGSPVFNIQHPDQCDAEKCNRSERTLRREDLDIHQSVLSQRKDPDQYPELTFIGNQFSKVRLFRESNLGRNSPPRMPQPPDLPEDFLLEDMSNLGLVLNDLQHHTTAKKAIVENLKLFYPEFDDITTKIHGGTIQIFLHEKNLHHPIPATRLSDGTLRFLCLLVILCHPNPPPLICIEEPELGLHPDILPHVAQLLLEASSRTQLIVTTHSDILVDEFTDTPEFVIVCEKENGSTSMQRLDADALNVWLRKYSLGELWRSGEIGGNRW